jgi:predicted Zn-dependent protease
MIGELSTLLAALDIPADWIGLRGVRETATTRSVRDGLPEANGMELHQGVMVEVLVNGQIGYAATNSIKLASLKVAAQHAYRQAIAASEWSIHPMTIADRPRVTGNYVSPYLKPFDALTPAEISEILVKICQTLKVSDRVVQTNAMVTTSDRETWFVSSNGSEVYQKFLLIGTDYSVTAQAGAIIQRRSNHGWLARCYQGGMERFLEPDLWEQVDQVGTQVLELLTAEECPTETTMLVLAPDQMMLQIHESVGHPLELDRILGDERNYAGGSFVQPQDFGERIYGSPLMNITFDPTVSGEQSSYQFDDIGAPATREYLVQQGKLVRGVGSIDSQTRLGVPGVASSRACSWNRPPIDRMANLNLEPGNTPFEELICPIERGVYMESNRSWSIDDQRYKFQFGCEYAKLIENGQLTKTLRNPNYRGTTPEFWRNLVQLGDRATWEMYGTFYCGKGEPNQAIWVGHGSPIAVFADVEVFGGGA